MRECEIVRRLFSEATRSQTRLRLPDDADGEKILKDLLAKLLCLAGMERKKTRRRM